MLHGRRGSQVAVRTAYRVSPRGQIFPQWPPDHEGFDVVADVVPDGVIRHESPLERLHEPAPGAVAS
jgi:hypothetical protein